jgi:condensin complex subunit 2
VPLNDDRHEKAIRRHAQQEAQRNSLRASTATATPGKRRISAPHTPSQDQDDFPDVTVTGTAVTPGNRVMPLLANFEEWMKMATDNVGMHARA